MKSFVDSLNQRWGVAARRGLGVGIGLILLVTVAVGYWLLRADYQVLFTDMAPQDAAAMTAELERQKIPYQLSEQHDGAGNSGITILVDRADVYKTRIKLMGKDIPLHGAVGFELFNASDLGMTEFAQKINFQRALQGELTRTVLSLDEIKDARILLALPDQGLFKQATNKPKASVTVTLKQGRKLRADQVSGIQRLVSAAVPGIVAQDVTIVDQTGVALTRASGEGNEAEAGSAGTVRLDLKKDTETYLSRKATQVLERALGEGQASASVDVTLNMDRVQTSTDELIGAPSKPGAAITGVVTRERETIRDIGGPLGSSTAGAATAGPLGGSNQRETDYAVGHRVEQVVSQPGSIRRLQVAVVTRKSMNPSQQEQLRTMVAAAVGASPERGDSVIVHSADGFISAAVSSPSMAEREVQAPKRADRGAPVVPRAASSWTETAAAKLGLPAAGFALGIAMLAALVVLGIVLSQIMRSRRASSVALTDAQREEMLEKLQGWLRTPSASASGADMQGARNGASPSTR